MHTRTAATIADLYNVPDSGKAEIVDGELVVMPPTGFWPSRASGEIFASLREYERRTKQGYAIPDNAGFVVDLPNRSSFSPAAAFYMGRVTGMRFLEGAPVFAVELRSEGDYGPQAERDSAAKRADYLRAGTLVVWDVDLLSTDVVKTYRASDPHEPTIYRRGDVANAEPALPGWSIPVDDLFT
ncbi:MAG TPA: Uma2 family endonuclease [Ardenticatenaceae bacterium]|nr:Uma2 family endonuclease [Ardenticatenaceae bacterium]